MDEGGSTSTVSEGMGQANRLNTQGRQERGTALLCACFQRVQREIDVPRKDFTTNHPVRL